MNSALNALATTLAIALLAVSTAAVAADDEHAAHHPDSVTASPAASPGDAMAGMKKMQEQMAAIRASKDSEERARLMEEHMQTMQSTMQQMRETNGCMMGNGMQGGQSGGTNMMQMMMEQMMQHQKAMQGMGK